MFEEKIYLEVLTGIKNMKSRLINFLVDVHPITLNLIRLIIVNYNSLTDNFNYFYFLKLYVLPNGQRTSQVQIHRRTRWNSIKAVGSMVTMCCKK